MASGLVGQARPTVQGTQTRRLDQALRLPERAARRVGAATGRIEGPPYHLDIQMLRALLPSALWQWPAPPYPAVPHPAGWNELAIVLTRR